MLTRRSLAVASLAAAPLAAAMSVAESGSRHLAVLRSGVMRELPHLMDVARVPAVGCALIENGRITEVETLGLRKAGGPAVTPRTFFGAASLTKPVFATVVLALADRGSLDLDRPLQSYLPLFEDPLARTVTARHVLSHSTGLPNWNFDLKTPVRSSFVPGSQWSYSGEGYYYLLQVIEHVTGTPCAALFDEFVFRPAGMPQSTITWNDAVDADNAWPHDNSGDAMQEPLLLQTQVAVRYRHAKEIGLPMERWMTADALRACAANGEKAVPGNAYPNPAFGLWTTPAEYARFLIHASANRKRRDAIVRLRGNLAWGLGWGLELASNHRFAWHWGDADGVKNMFMFDLSSQSGVVVFTNGDNGSRIYRRLVRQLFAREFDAFLWI